MLDLIQMTHERRDPPISRLPVELLVKTFSYCVDEKCRPMTLSQVCRLWREIVCETKGLWTIVDLSLLEEAKHHIRLARDANLRVVWFDRHHGVTKQNNYGWIWSHSSRFSHLHLVIPARIVTQVFASMGAYLPELLDLTVITHDHYFPSMIYSEMPKLRILHLS